jgi:hypothetical protein
MNRNVISGMSLWALRTGLRCRRRYAGGTAQIPLPACHSLDASRVGPMPGVFGRKAGSVPDFDYSPAVKSKIVWNDRLWISGLSIRVVRGEDELAGCGHHVPTSCISQARVEMMRIPECCCAHFAFSSASPVTRKVVSHQGNGTGAGRADHGVFSPAPHIQAPTAALLRDAPTFCNNRARP